MTESVPSQKELEKPLSEDVPLVESSVSQNLSSKTSSTDTGSNMDENPKEVAASQNAPGLIYSTFSRGLVFLKNIFFEELPSPLQECLSLLAKNFRQKGNQVSRLSVVRSYVRCMDDFVDTSGSIVRRLHRVVETETHCLPTCPYLQHYVNCPLADTPLCSNSEAEGHVEDEDSVKKSPAELAVKPSAELLVKKEPEGETLMQDESSSEAKQKYPTVPQEKQELSDLYEDQKPLTTNAFVQEYYLEKLFSFAFTWLVLYPVNTLVAFLNFQRSLTHDVDDYFRVPSGYVTAVGRRVLSPRRVIRSRVLVRAKTLLKEVVQLSAGDRTMPFKLSLDPNLRTLRAQPVYETRKATLKRKMSLEDLAESFISDDDLPDDDYVPSSPSQSSSTDNNEYDASITVSENDLSVHEEDGFLALKEVKDAQKEPLKGNEYPDSREEKLEKPNSPSVNVEPMDIDESQC